MKTTAYIAFLRGINVGGHRVKMEHLRGLFSELGFAEVRNYIQTGNIFFETTENDRAVLTEKIERHLFSALGYQVPVFLRTIAEVERALQLNPFGHIEATADTRFCLTFISEPLPENFRLPFVSPKNDFEILQATSGEAFILMRLIDDRPGNPAAFIEKNFKLKTTTRFFGTTEKILQAAKNI